MKRQHASVGCAADRCGASAAQGAGATVPVPALRGQAQAPQPSCISPAESANALFRRAQTPANAERLSTNIWAGVTATRSTRRWLYRGRAFAVAPSSFALDIPHVAFSTGEQGISQRKAESSVSFSGARACARARAGVAWRRAAGGGRCGGAWRRAWRRVARGRRLAVFAYRRQPNMNHACIVLALI